MGIGWDLKLASRVTRVITVITDIQGRVEKAQIWKGVVKT
jgi:hypothetical protein